MQNESFNNANKNVEIIVNGVTITRILVRGKTRTSLGSSIPIKSKYKHRIVHIMEPISPPTIPIIKTSKRKLFKNFTRF